MSLKNDFLGIIFNIHWNKCGWNLTTIYQIYQKIEFDCSCPSTLSSAVKNREEQLFSKQVGHRSIMDKASACGAKGRGIESRSFSFFYSKKPFHLLKIVLHDDLRHSYTQQRGPLQWTHQKKKRMWWKHKKTGVVNWKRRTGKDLRVDTREELKATWCHP